MMIQTFQLGSSNAVPVTTLRAAASLLPRNDAVMIRGPIRNSTVRDGHYRNLFRAAHTPRAAEPAPALLGWRHHGVIVSCDL